MVSGPQDNPPIEGQIITYTCPFGFLLTGPNASVCTGNGEWESDPGQVDCIGNYQPFEFKTIKHKLILCSIRDIMSLTTMQLIMAVENHLWTVMSS